MKFNFNLKFYFHYFLILGIRDERKSDKILMIKKKILVEIDSSHENKWFFVSMSFFYEKNLYKVFPPPL
jgi:hypothetical protein